MWEFTARPQRHRDGPDSGTSVPWRVNPGWRASRRIDVRRYLVPQASAEHTLADLVKPRPGFAVNMHPGFIVLGLERNAVPAA